MRFFILLCCIAALLFVLHPLYSESSVSQNTTEPYNTQNGLNFLKPVERKEPVRETAQSVEAVKGIETPEKPLSEGGIRPFSTPGFTAEQILWAMTKAYPDRINSITYSHGDWAVEVRGDRFYWAHGRLLPETLRDRWVDYDPYPFYSYSDNLPPVPELSDEEKRLLEQRLRDREKDPTSRHPGFYNALWRLHDQHTSWDRMKTTYFLGIRTEIHRELLEDLAAVEEEIYRKMNTDTELREFVRSVADLEGYNWRPIAGTSSLSFHSYGTAIDILPRSYGGKQVYWRWAKPNFKEWYSLPYEKRFMPPLSFVKAFENHGFIWGGKWFYFDTIHFEYRPEILLLNGIDFENGF